MESYVRGDIVFVPFPFSDLSSTKQRPALVLKNFEGNDLLLVQLTSMKAGFSRYSLVINYDFLEKMSYIKCNKLFTCDENIVLKKLGTLSYKDYIETHSTIINKVLSIEN